MGYKWKTAEHAYQAMKFQNEDFWNEMAYGNLSAGEAKKIGAGLTLSDWWSDNKLHIMRNIVTRKFEDNDDLMEMLMETKGCELIEGNTWGDVYWGQSPLGHGKNHLGKILMAIRDDITRNF
jgi:N-glycosidase YbiA